MPMRVFVLCSCCQQPLLRRGVYHLPQYGRRIRRVHPSAELNVGMTSGQVGAAQSIVSTEFVLYVPNFTPSMQPRLEWRCRCNSACQQQLERRQQEGAAPAAAQQYEKAGWAGLRWYPAETNSTLVAMRRTVVLFRPFAGQEDPYGGWQRQGGVGGKAAIMSSTAPRFTSFRAFRGMRTRRTSGGQREQHQVQEGGFLCCLFFTYVASQQQRVSGLCVRTRAHAASQIG